MKGREQRQPGYTKAGLLLAATLVTLATTVGAHDALQEHTATMTTGDRVCARAGPSLPLMLINEGRADEASLDIARREAHAIWASASVRLVWTTPETFGDSSRYPGVFVVIRRDLFRGRSEAFETSRRGPLVMGRVRFGGDSPARLIEVSLGAVRMSLSKARDHGPRTRALLVVAGPGAIGRALGRVIAHEVGHWLFGRAHTPDGLMKPTLHPQELLAPKAPALPRGWNVPEAARRRGLPSSCEDDEMRGSPLAVRSKTE